MEDDNLLHLLNQHHDGPKATTPIQSRREPLGEIVENDDHSSIVTMTCLNDRVPSDKVKRHFDDIRLVRPSSATSQGGSHTKRVEKVIGYPPHLVSGGNRNSTDNLIQSSIDVTLSSNSSREELQRQRPPPLEEEELAIVTIIGADDDAERENENPFDRTSAGAFSTPPTSPKSSVPSQAHSTPDVQVSRFDRDETTSRAAFARSQLAKRLLVNQAQQRPIPIQSLSNTANHDLTSNSDQQAATSLAATVAASVAVSVAQPFLKLQNELEHKMNSVLDQIQQQQKRALCSGLTVPVTTVAHASTRSEECAENRMKYMEKVQEKQQQVLQQLVDMVHTTKPKSKSPKSRRKTFAEVNEFSPPAPQPHFLDTLVGPSSPPVRRTKSPKKHHAQKKTSTSPGPSKRPSRVTGAGTRTVKIRSPITFKQQPPNGRLNNTASSPSHCTVCDRSRSRSRSRSPTKGLSPDSSYPRPFAPVPRPPSIMSDGFIPGLGSPDAGNALRETYLPFDKYLNNSAVPSPLQPKPSRCLSDNTDLHERIKLIDDAKNQLDENYLTLQRQKTDVHLLEPNTNDSSRIQRLVEQCVKQVTRQVRDEVKTKLEQEELEANQKPTVVVHPSKKRAASKTHLAFDRHSTVRSGRSTTPADVEPAAATKPYSDAFMEAIYGRALYQKIKKEGKQPYFKLKQQTVHGPKQPKPIEQVPVRDTGLKPPSHTTPAPPRRPTEPHPSHPQPTYEPEYYIRPNGATLLGPPQIRDTRTFQPNYGPLAPRPAPQVLPTIDHDRDDEDDGHGIQIPGYHRPSDDQTYDGPKFPPTIPHDEGYRNRQYDSLQTGAIDWLEQELIARFMSQLQNQHTTVPIRQHRDVLSARSSTSSSSDDRSLHDRLLDLLGRDGFQLFIDMGQPIDQDLIQALTREVLEERISQMIGFRSPRESIHVVPPPPAPPPRTTTPTATHPVIVDQHPWPQEHSVPTPQPTPPQSPPPPPRHPRVVTPEITGQQVSSESGTSTPRSMTPQEDLDRTLPPLIHHSIGTPEPSQSPSPPVTPQPLPLPPRVIQKHDASTMASIDLPAPPPPVIIQPPRAATPPPPPPPPPPKARTPSPISSTSSSSSSSPVSSSSLSSFSIPYSSNDSPFSDHMWFDDRSEGQIDLLDPDRPHTELIMKQVQRLLHERRRPISAATTAEVSFISPPQSPAGGTHTLSIGEIPPAQYPNSSGIAQQDNGHTTPPGSDESNNSGKSEGEMTSSMMLGQQPPAIHIKYRRSAQGFLGKKNNRK